MKVVRRIEKYSTTAGEKPTVPPSDNHEDGSWIATDIYKGELFFNRADGIWYSRDDNGIFIVGEKATLIYEAFITQSGTGAPTVDVKRNTIGAIVWARNVAGQYTGTLTGAFPSGDTALIIGANNNSCFSTALYRNSANIVVIETRNSALALADSLLTDRYIKIMIIP